MVTSSKATPANEEVARSMQLVAQTLGCPGTTGAIPVRTQRRRCQQRRGGGREQAALSLAPPPTRMTRRQLGAAQPQTTTRRPTATVGFASVCPATAGSVAAGAATVGSTLPLPSGARVSIFFLRFFFYFCMQLNTYGSHLPHCKEGLKLWDLQNITGQ